MPKLTVTKLLDRFEYRIDGAILVKEQETLFLTALSAYIMYDFTNESNWGYERSAPDPGSVQASYPGLNGLQYKTVFPTMFFERQETGTDPVMGGPIYTFVRIYDVWDGLGWIISEDDIWVASPVGGREPLGLWLDRELFIGTVTSSGGTITGIKELTTGYVIPSSKLSILLSLTGEPLPTERPVEVAGCVKFIRTLYEIRSTATRSISSDGEIS